MTHVQHICSDRKQQSEETVSKHPSPYLALRLLCCCQCLLRLLQLRLLLLQVLLHLGVVCCIAANHAAADALAAG